MTRIPFLVRKLAVFGCLHKFSACFLPSRPFLPPPAPFPADSLGHSYNFYFACPPAAVFLYGGFSFSWAALPRPSCYTRLCHKPAILQQKRSAIFYEKTSPQPPRGKPALLPKTAVTLSWRLPSTCPNRRFLRRRELGRRKGRYQRHYGYDIRACQYLYTGADRHVPLQGFRCIIRLSLRAGSFRACPLFAALSPPMSSRDLCFPGDSGIMGEN